jgi:hypothetical protein
VKRDVSFLSFRWYLAIIYGPEYFLRRPFAASTTGKRPTSLRTRRAKAGVKAILAFQRSGSTSPPDMGDSRRSNVKENPNQSVEEPEIIFSQNEPKRHFLYG